VKAAKKKVLRCAKCKRKIRDYHPDVILEDLGTGTRRYYHSLCAAAAYALAASSAPGVYVLTHRYVEPEAN
jgi:hypothetical protein